MSVIFPDVYKLSGLILVEFMVLSREHTVVALDQWHSREKRAIIRIQLPYSSMTVTIIAGL